jgi:hypothetical protein
VYDEFLKNEREFSARFLKSQQILTDRFSDKEYLVIKELFKNEKMIEKIYEVIDNIIKKEKLNYMSRSLIMGDFLFSICFLNSSDSSCWNLYLSLLIWRGVPWCWIHSPNIYSSHLNNSWNFLGSHHNSRDVGLVPEAHSVCWSW